MRTVRRAAAALAMATVLAGCGDTGGTDGIGEATKVFDVVRVDQERVRGRAVLRAGQTLSTEQFGVARFKLHTGLADCETKKGSSVQVSPPDTEWLAVIHRGLTQCNGQAFKPGQAVAVRDHELVAVDSTFGVEVDDRRFTLAVYRGFVDVRSRQQPRLVGPDSQVEVPEGQDVSTVRPTDAAQLDQAERETVAGLEAAFPAPPFGLPQPGDSPALRRVNSGRTLRLALDRGAGGPSEQFVRSVLDFLAERWSVQVEVTKRTPEAARAGLRSGDVDVTASPVAIAGSRPVPFFADESGRPWSLHVNETDTELGTALVGFLGPALEVGEYGRRYRESFGQVPEYEVVRPVIFADQPLGPAPSPSAPPPPNTAPGSPAPTVPGAPPGSSSPGTSPPPTEPPVGPLSTTTAPPSKGTTTVPPQCEGKVATIAGTPGPDVLRGTDGADVIAGMGGNDDIYGRGGDDTICGNQGDDRIYGDDGNDTIAGNDGNDVLYDGPGDDLVLAYEGDDKLYDGEGADVLDGGRDSDVIYGNGGRDTMRGGEGDDELVSNGSHDDGSPDILEGGPGRDLLNAADGASNDRLNGGPGSQDRCLADTAELTIECEVFS